MFWVGFAVGFVGLGLTYLGLVIAFEGLPWDVDVRAGRAREGLLRDRMVTLIQLGFPREEARKMAEADMVKEAKEALATP